MVEFVPSDNASNHTQKYRVKMRGTKTSGILLDSCWFVPNVCMEILC